MKRFNHIFYAAAVPAFVSALALSGCSGTSEKNSSAAVTGIPVTEIPPDTIAFLELPQIPATIRTPEGKAGFIAIHFWDNLDFRDHRKSLDVNFMEQNFVDYLSILPAVMAEDRVMALNILLERSSATPETRELIESLGIKYLSHPDSPMHNDEYFADFVAAMKKSDR